MFKFLICLIVTISFSDEEFICVLSDYKIDKYPGDFGNFSEEDQEKLLNLPFYESMRAYAKYEPVRRIEEPEEESEKDIEVEITRGEDEDEETPKVTKSFKPDKCVICLSNEPNILFSNCKHICICLECEEVNPLNSCPYCRSIVIEKNSI